MTNSVGRICEDIRERFEKMHIKTVDGRKILLISAQYPGLWMEHVYDSVLYAKMDNSKLYLAKNAVEIFIDNQKPDGQYPFMVLADNGKCRYGYSQIQEVVSFITLAYETALMLDDDAFFRKVYDSGVQWINWLETFRMTTRRGLIELFVGHDTGHDGSKRLFGLSCPGNYVLPDGSRANAAVLPPNESVAPMLAVDMNCHFYGDLCALGKIARRLSMTDSAKMWEAKAQNVKHELFARCLDKDDMFFYDVDKNDKKRKYRSCTIFHLFMEGVLDPETDREITEALYNRHIKNPEEFWTQYPFPSMALNDKSCEGHATFNCWGYYTQGLIVLRCTRWMDKYGYSEDFDYICRKWLEAWTACYDTFKMGQEIDPITGIPTASSEWYSSCMLMYLYAAQRMKGKI